MTWGHPWLAMLLPAGLAVLLALRTWWGRRVMRRQRTLGAGLTHLTGSVHRPLERVRMACLWGGMLAIALAIAGPRWGSEMKTQRQSGADILLLLDCSRSMLSRDLYPTRMEAARHKALDLLDLAPEMRIALMPFAAVPVLRCPFTGDRAALEQMLHDCSPDLFPADEGYQGTAIGDAITEGMRVMARGSERGQAMLVMSDGADDDTDAVEKAANAAHDAGIPVFGLFLGDADAKTTLAVDGHEQPMTPVRATLDRLASRTGGICVTASNDTSDVQALIARIETTVTLGAWEHQARTVASERYQWPLAVGILGLFLACVIPTWRRAQVPSMATSGLVRAALLMLVPLASLLAADPWDDLTTALGQPEDQRRQAIEHLLIEHPAFYAAHYDLGTLLLASDPTQAIAHLQAATISPDPALAADAFLNLSLGLLSQGRLDESLAAVAQAARLNAALGPLIDQVRAKILVIKDEARRAAEEAAKRLHIVTASLPDATAGDPYLAMIQVAGGRPPYRFDPVDDASPSAAAGGTVTSDPSASSPPGDVRLDPDGRLHGVPRSEGHRTLHILVHDAQTTATRTIALTVQPPPAILPDRLPEAVSGQPYAATLSARGLVNPRWHALGLPDGLTLEDGSAGMQVTINGSPQRAGDATITVTADDGMHTATHAYLMKVSDAFAPDVVDLPPATAGAVYHARLGVRGPPLTYHWTINAPVDGLSIDDAGTVSGTPDVAGHVTLPLTLAASDGRQRGAEVSILINEPPVIDETAPLVIASRQAVEHPLHHHGGTPDFTWRLSEGALPAGIRLDADGVLRGAATTIGTTHATIAMSDRWQSETSTHLSVQVTAPTAHQPPPQESSTPPAHDATKDTPPPSGKDATAGADATPSAADTSHPPPPQPSSSPSAGAASAPSSSPSGTSSPADDASTPPSSTAASPSTAPSGSPGSSPSSASSASPAEAPGHPGDQHPAAPSNPAAQAATGDASAASGSGDHDATSFAGTGPDASGATAQPQAHAAPGTAAAGARPPGQADAAAVRWLGTLPAEDHDALRGQLLHSAPPPPQKGNPW